MNKRKKIIIIIFVLIVIVILTVIIHGKTNHKCSVSELIDYSNSSDELIITGYQWSGWVKCYSPTKIKNGYKIELNKEINFECHNHCKNLTFKIIEQNESYITIETEKEFLETSDAKKTFKINKNSKIKIKTNTLDAGDIYIIEYK